MTRAPFSGHSDGTSSGCTSSARINCGSMPFSTRLPAPFAPCGKPVNAKVASASGWRPDVIVISSPSASATHGVQIDISAVGMVVRSPAPEPGFKGSGSKARSARFRTFTADLAVRETTAESSTAAAGTSSPAVGTVTSAPTQKDGTAPKGNASAANSPRRGTDIARQAQLSAGGQDAIRPSCVTIAADPAEPRSWDLAPIHHAVGNICRWTFHSKTQRCAIHTVPSRPAIHDSTTG